MTPAHTSTRSGKHAKPRVRATLAQIAKASGYSVSTVSAVLNDRPDCWASQATRDRVLEIAAQMEYRPNLLARSLQGGKTWTLGMLMAALDVEVSTAKVQAFEAAARSAGYITMMTFSPNDDPQVEDRLITSLLDRGVDGLVVYPTEAGQHLQLRRAIELGVAVITLDGHGRAELDCDDVSMDYAAAGALQARHLIELGHRRLVQINNLPSCYTKDQLKLGFLDEARRAGLPEPMTWLINMTTSNRLMFHDTLWQAIASLMREHRGQFDAIASYDLVAAATLRAAFEMGWRVPDELSIVGADGTSTANNGPIPLTTVVQPVKKTGQALFEILNKRIEAGDKPTPRQRLVLKPDLITRASTMKHKTTPAL